LFNYLFMTTTMGTNHPTRPSRFAMNKAEGTSNHGTTI
jgi:hypothetical protein